MNLYLNEYLPILVYILLCILLVLLIIICVRILKALEKISDIANNVDKKVKSLNGIFSIIDGVTDKLSALTEVISDSIIIFIKSVFKKKKKKIDEEKEGD